MINKPLLRIKGADICIPANQVPSNGPTICPALFTDV